MCAVHGFWLPISEIPDCPSIDGSIPAAATDTDGGLGTFRILLNYTLSVTAAACLGAAGAYYEAAERPRTAPPAEHNRAMGTT